MILDRLGTPDNSFGKKNYNFKSVVLKETCQNIIPKPIIKNTPIISKNIRKISELIRSNIDINQKENQTLKTETNMLDQSDNDVKHNVASDSQELIDIEGLKGFNYIQKKFLDRCKDNQHRIKLLELSKKFIEQFYTKSYQDIKSELKNLKGQSSLDGFIYGEDKDQGYLAFNDKLWGKRFAIGMTHIIYQLKAK